MELITTTQKNLLSGIEQKAELIENLFKEHYAGGIETSDKDEEAKSFINSAKEILNTYEEERLNFTRELDKVKKVLITPANRIKAVVKEAGAKRDIYQTNVKRALEVENYREEFTTVMKGSLKVIAFNHVKNGVAKAKAIQLHKIISEPWQQHLKPIYAELCEMHQAEAISIYSKYYSEAPEPEKVEQEIETIKAVTELDLGEIKSQTLDFKPKGSRSVVRINVTSPTGLFNLFEIYFKSLGAGVLTEKKLDFVKKWAEKNIDQEQLSKIEGVQAIEEIKSSAR